MKILVRNGILQRSHANRPIPHFVEGVVGELKHVFQLRKIYITIFFSLFLFIVQINMQKSNFEKNEDFS